jgi:hypothetical protein
MHAIGCSEEGGALREEKVVEGARVPEFRALPGTPALVLDAAQVLGAHIVRVKNQVPVCVV